MKHVISQKIFEFFKIRSIFEKNFEVSALRQIIFTTVLVLVFGFSVFAQSSLCAKIEVSGGGVVRIGEPMSFSAKVTGLTNNSALEYEWKVSSGTISSGQKTPSITVDTTGLEDTNITAEVKINGLYDICANTASEVGSIIPSCRLPRMFDEFGKLSDKEIKARIQNLYVEILNNPNSQGYILNYGTDKEIANQERQIKKAINFLKLDPTRVTIVRGGANPNGGGIWTKIWLQPPGVDNPQR